MPWEPAGDCIPCMRYYWIHDQDVIGWVGSNFRMVPSSTRIECAASGCSSSLLVSNIENIWAGNHTRPVKSCMTGKHTWEVACGNRARVVCDCYLSAVWSGRLIPAPPRVSFRRLGQVPLHVQREVVGACERALADGALERLCARVLAVVARQLVRPREPPFALRPLTRVRLLTWGYGAHHSTAADNHINIDDSTQVAWRIKRHARAFFVSFTSCFLT